MKYFSEYLVAAALAVGVLTVAAIDVQAATVCGPNGCHRAITRTARSGQSVSPANITTVHRMAAPWSPASGLVDNLAQV